jgi:hypothetical protein
LLTLRVAIQSLAKVVTKTSHFFPGFARLAMREKGLFSRSGFAAELVTLEVLGRFSAFRVAAREKIHSISRTLAMAPQEGAEAGTRSWPY